MMRFKSVFLVVVLGCVVSSLAAEPADPDPKRFAKAIDDFDALGQQERHAR